MKIGGADQSLPNFPYDLSDSTGRAQMQTDLVALGWTGATVTGVGSAGWSIYIPAVPLSGYNVTSRVSWPVYYVTNPLGSSEAVDGSTFTAETVNEDGIRTNVPCQFGRLKLFTTP